MHEWVEILITILCSTGIITGVVGLFFKKMERNAERREKRFEERELARIESEKLNKKMLFATFNLAVATAKAVQNIPDAHADGEITAALKQADTVKAEQIDLINEAAAERLYSR